MQTYNDLNIFEYDTEVGLAQKTFGKVLYNKDAFLFIVFDNRTFIYLKILCNRFLQRLSIRECHQASE